MTRRPWPAYAALWAGATGLAVLLTWYGVHDVLRAAVFDGPALVPPLAVPSHPATPPPVTSPSPTPRPTSHSSTPRPTPTPHTTAPATPDNITSYSTPGGRVALALTASEVRVVSATPQPGYQMTITREPFWLRVDFINGPRTSSVIASWYQHAPTVQTYEH